MASAVPSGARAGGAKRPAAATTKEDAEDGAIAIAGQREQRSSLADPGAGNNGVDATNTTLLRVAPVQAPGVGAPVQNEEGQELGEDAGDVDDKIAYVGNVGHIDITCHIACFMNTGQGLRNMCISVGRKDAAIIRNKFLHKNDAYLVKWMRRLSAIMCVTERGQAGWLHFKDNLHVFDKCREGVVAWMVVNDDWKERCTLEKIEMYKRSELMRELHFEADVIFNNLVVAIEIGLLDVVRFLTNEKEVDVKASQWSGFSTGGFHANSPYIVWPVEVALVRCDVEILQHIVYVDGFDLTRMIDEGGHLRDILATTIIHGSQDYVSSESFRCLISHPSVDLSHYSHGLLPLGMILIGYMSENDSEKRRVILSRVRMLLEEGADPRMRITTTIDRTCIEYVRARYERADSATKSRWNVLLQLLERPVL